MPGPFVVWQAARRARRLYPVAMMAYQRWQQMSPEEKERYKQRAREYAERGRAFVDERRGGGGGRPGGRGRR
jgi:hypothetical protein